MKNQEVFQMEATESFQLTDLRFQILQNYTLFIESL
jgi:hypothetical protein